MVIVSNNHTIFCWVYVNQLLGIFDLGTLHRFRFCHCRNSSTNDRIERSVFLLLFMLSICKIHIEICRKLILQLCGILSLWARLIERNLHRIPFDRKNWALNNLACEFSAQIQLDPFFISPNGFFNINLNLLGSVGDFI